MRLATIASGKFSPPAPGFDAAAEIAACRPTRTHRGVVAILDRAYDGLRFEFASTWPDPGWRDGQIRGATGRIVTSTPREWILERMRGAGTQWRAEAERLRASKLRRTHFVSQPLFFTARYGPAAWDFVQVRVHLVHEAHAPLLLPEDWCCDKPEDVAGWVDFREHAPAIGPQRYELSSAIDVAAFVEERAARWRDAFNRRLPIVAEKRITTIFVGENRRIEERIGDRPDFQRTPGRCSLQRLFDDWTDSSAGRSGERFERHWVIQENEIPRWVNDPRLPSIAKARICDAGDFIKWLAAFDRRAGYPFAWYTYMLHGNKIHAGYGQRAWELVKSGAMPLTERDVEVLRRWAERSYGF